SSSDRGVQCVRDGAWYTEIPYSLSITTGGPTTSGTPSTAGPVVQEREPNNDFDTAMLVQPGTTVSGALTAGVIRGRATDIDFYRVPVTSPGLYTVSVALAVPECAYSVGLPNLRRAQGPSTMTVELTGEQRTEYVLRFGGQPEERSGTFGPEPRELIIAIDTEAWSSSSDRGVQCVRDGAWYTEIPYSLTIEASRSATASSSSPSNADPTAATAAGTTEPRPGTGVFRSPDFGEPSTPSGRISNIVTARDVRAGAPVDITDTFTPDVNPIHVWFRLDGFAPGTILTTRWTYLGGSAPLIIGTGEATVVPTNNYGTFSYELAPGKRWPAGEYRVDILLGGTALGAATFLVHPGPSATLSLPPQPDTSTADSSPYKRGSISTAGPAVELAVQSVPAGGGTITVNRRGDPLDGLVVSVPPGAYDAAQTFRVSSQPIDSTTFAYVTPATPLIHIDNGGEFANNLMTVKVPVEIPAGQFAMAFFYDGLKHRLEGIPTVAMDSESITIATGHFSYFFVSRVDADRLTGDIIDSGFKPGRDEWQFGNHNSLIVNGRCAGTSATEIWYYYEAPDGEGAHLYGRYEGTDGQHTPGFDWDDVEPQRLVISVQADYEDRGIQLERTFRETMRLSDAVTVKLFAYAILVTGGPQLVEYPNHAMVATAVKGDTIFIADPDFPGRLGQTRLKDGRLEYVWDEQTLGGVKQRIEHPIYYAAVGALVSWDRLAARWSEFRSGTPGDDRFPPYKTYIWSEDETGREIPLQTPDGTRVELAEGLTLAIRGIRARFEAPDWTPTWAQQFAFRDPTYFLDSPTSVGSGKRYLKPGEPLLLGVQAKGEATTKYDGSNSGWLGFDWVTIRYNPPERLVLSPSSWSGAPGQSQPFVVTSPTPLTGLRFEWLVDNQAAQSGYAPAYTYRASRPGEHTVTVNAWDDTIHQIVVSASLTLTVKDGTAPATTLLPTPEAVLRATVARLGLPLAPPRPGQQWPDDWSLGWLECRDEGRSCTYNMDEKTPRTLENELKRKTGRSVMLGTERLGSGNTLDARLAPPAEGGSRTTFRGLTALRETTARTDEPTDGAWFVSDARTTLSAGAGDVVLVVGMSISCVDSNTRKCGPVQAPDAGGAMNAFVDEAVAGGLMPRGAVQ
ncbi:MAG: hypothetical protein O2930_14755, partial [Acidobacteria bacterium]|nr:hypothetical protein [Acidobacteriota bacterium]